ncbi:hypothetical protein [Halalkalibacter okhensis]|uniref:hypothetical protein n=1 Tax=Halalkalibacter okhensis TaxID=333138 RepID=UPI000ABCB594|nr:hypothetical protein [Halalkalibacter okhensis]
MLEFISQNIFFLLTLIVIGLFIILRLKKNTSERSVSKDIELLKRRVEELERNK